MQWIILILATEHLNWDECQYTELRNDWLHRLARRWRLAPDWSRRKHSQLSNGKDADTRRSRGFQGWLYDVDFVPLATCWISWGAFNSIPFNHTLFIPLGASLIFYDGLVNNTNNNQKSARPDRVVWTNFLVGYERYKTVNIRICTATILYKINQK